MPTYEYVCEKCGHHFEKYQPISDKTLTTCPKELCPKKTWGKGKVRRAISGGAGLLFKGSGFYITDYRSEGYKEAAKKDVAAPAASDSGGSKESAAPKEGAKATPAAKESAKPKESKSSSAKPKKKAD